LFEEVLFFHNEDFKYNLSSRIFRVPNTVICVKVNLNLNKE